MGPLDQGGLRRFLGRGSEVFEAGLETAAGGTDRF